MLNFFRILFLPLTATFEFITKYFKTVVFLTILYFYVSSQQEVSLSQQSFNAPNLQKIELFGPILDVRTILEDINKAKTNENIKGVLLIVNSPGGAVAPSVELTYAIKELTKIKPVVAYASGIMASGSYYASIYADRIFANPGSMVGSIGVIFQGANFEELMQKIGVKTQTVKVGKYKEAGTPTRVWNEYEKEELDKVINDTYDMFVSDVAKARKLKKEDHEVYADAHIFTARQAQEVGLIDEVSTISKAKDFLIKVSKVDEARWQQEDKFEAFMDKILKEVVSQFSITFSNGLKAY